MMPGTYFDPSDNYVRGIRYFDHKSFEMARQSWEPMAKAGDCDAEYRMGTLYFLGAGVPMDYKAAHEWWLTAANKGQAFAQFLLAVMYAHDVVSVKTVNMTAWFNCRQGCGYEKDLLAAYQWMRLAERNTPYDDNRKYANEIAEKYKQSLTAGQISDADRYVREWKPPLGQCEQRRIL
jgi:uncharacterized protein